MTQFKENEIHQFFVQGGQAIDMPNSTIAGVPGNRLDTDYCSTQFNATNSRDRFDEVGGWPTFNQALSSPWVLVMSLWDDHYANMLWLDSTYPTDQAGQPGADRGDCDTSSGVPSDVESSQASSVSILHNRRGDLCEQGLSHCAASHLLQHSLWTHWLDGVHRAYLDVTLSRGFAPQKRHRLHRRWPPATRR